MMGTTTTRAAASIARRVSMLTGGLDAAGKDRLTHQLEAAGYKGELAKARGGNLARAIETYKLFHGLRPEADGVELLAHTELPRCGHRDRDWLDEDGEYLETPTVVPLLDRDGTATYKVGWKFGRLPDGNDDLPGDSVAQAFASTAAIYAHFFKIRLDVLGADGFDQADRYLIDAQLAKHVLAQQWMQEDRMPEDRRFRGEYNSHIAWTLKLLAMTDLHECGHYLGLRHHPGKNVMAPVIWDYPHPLNPSDPRPWLSSAEQATLRKIGYKVGPLAPRPTDPIPNPPTPTPPTSPIHSYKLDGTLSGQVIPLGGGSSVIAGIFAGRADKR